jgi:hypothetical protein
MDVRQHRLRLGVESLTRRFALVASDREPFAGVFGLIAGELR